MSKETYEKEFNGRASVLARELGDEFRAFKAKADAKLASLRRDAAAMQQRHGVSGYSPMVSMSFAMNRYQGGLLLEYNSGTNGFSNGLINISG